jgi:hypothetical protein
MLPKNLCNIAQGRIFSLKYSGGSSRPKVRVDRRENRAVERHLTPRGRSNQRNHSGRTIGKPEIAVQQPIVLHPFQVERLVLGQPRLLIEMSSGAGVIELGLEPGVRAKISTRARTPTERL